MDSSIEFTSSLKNRGETKNRCISLPGHSQALNSPGLGTSHVQHRGKDAEDLRAQVVCIQVSSSSCERDLPLPWGVMGHYRLPHKALEFNA